MLEIIDKNIRLDWLLESKDKFCLMFGLLGKEGARNYNRSKIKKHQQGSGRKLREVEE